MPLSRALKEVTTCTPANERKIMANAGKEKAPKPVEKQYNQTGPKAKGPNYPQWHLGKGNPITK